jgi:PAS domain S-box-containing protein
LSKVLSRPVTDLIRYFDERKIALDRAHLRSVRTDAGALPAWISWSDYAALLNAIDRYVPADRNKFFAEFVSWSYAGHARWTGLLRVFAAALVRPMQLYELFHWYLDTTISSLTAQMNVSGPSEVRFDIRVHEGFDSVQLIFDVGRYVLSLLPSLVGSSAAEVTMNVIEPGRHAVYTIALPKQVGYRHRLVLLLRSIFGRRKSKLTGESIDDELREEFMILVRAREHLESELRTGADRLAKSKADYELLMQNVPDSIITINRDRTIDYINRVLPPWTREQVVGQNCLAFVPPDLKDEYDRLLVRSFAHGEPGEMDLPVTDGTVWRVRVVPLVRNGAIEQVLAISTDVTQATHAAQRLAEARDVAVSASNAKSAFLANVSHEIRTPITAILGFSELLRESPALRDADRAAAKTIFNNSLHLKALIEDLLDISKIEAGSIELARDEFAALRLVCDTLELFSVQARAKGIDLICENCTWGEDVTVIGDMRRIKQILMNLIGNAVKFTDRGFVSLYRELRPAADGSGSLRLFVRIRDSGSGVAPAMKDRIFEPFEQGEQSLSKKQAGTGLGLYLSRQIAHLMKGEVWLEAAGPDGGATFCLEVGVQPARKVAAADPARTPEIMVVEDNPDIARLLEIVVKSAGMNVRLEDRGDLAVEAARSDEPDLIIMDLQLPVMDGYEAVKTLRSAGFNRPILGLTANARADDRQRCLSLGFSEYMAKPVDREELIRKIRALLAGTPSAGPV